MGAVHARINKYESKKDISTEKLSLSGIFDVKDDCCADGTQLHNFTRSFCAPLTNTFSESRNFEEFIYQIWGNGIAQHFAIPYNKKLWTVPLNAMETSWLGSRVPLPDLEEMIAGALEPVAKPVGPNARGYPLHRGFSALMEGFKPYLKGKIELNTEVVKIYPLEKKILTNNKTLYTYRQLVSTLPLPELIRIINDEAPEEIKAAARKLRHVSVRCINLGIGRERISDKHWVYYPEDTIFHRIFLQGNASPSCNPPGGFGLICEITYSPYKPLPANGQELIERCIFDSKRVGMIREDDGIITASQIDMPYAYVVYDHARVYAVQQIRNWLKQYDIILAGRYAEWEYYNSDHAFLAGKQAAEKVQAKRSLFSAKRTTTIQNQNLSFRL